MELFVEGKSLLLVDIPLPVYHEFKENWNKTAYFLSVPDESYNCSEHYEYRLLPLPLDKWFSA